MSQQLLTTLLEDFVDFYAVVNAPQVGDDPRVRLNNGDCGTASIAVGWVYTQLTRRLVKYHDNHRHAFLELHGRYYDTLQPEGCEHYENMHGWSHHNRHYWKMTKDPRVQHWQWLRTDFLGYSWICEFCARWGVKPYSLPAFYNNPLPEQTLHQRLQTIAADTAIIKYPSLAGIVNQYYEAALRYQPQRSLPLQYEDYIHGDSYLLSRTCFLQAYSHWQGALSTQGFEADTKLLFRDGDLAALLIFTGEWFPQIKQKPPLVQLAFQLLEFWYTQHSPDSLLDGDSLVKAAEQYYPTITTVKVEYKVTPRQGA